MLSSGNPYQVHLMEAVLTEDGTQPAPPRPGPLARRDIINPDFSNFPAGWNVFGGPFYPRFQCGPRWCLTTFGPGQDNSRGSIRQSFVPSELTAKLCFFVHGGSNVSVAGADAPNASVRLISGIDVVRESRGRSPMRDGSAWPESRVVWDLTKFIGREVTLEIHDERLADSYGWDFVGTSQFIQDSTVDACITRLGVTR
jgi:hypothetical protein